MKRHGHSNIGPATDLAGDLESLRWAIKLFEPSSGISQANSALRINSLVAFSDSRSVVADVDYQVVVLACRFEIDPQAGFFVHPMPDGVFNQRLEDQLRD